MIKRRKKANAKPASEAQKRARERNWNKGQIKNIIATATRIINSKTTNEKERTLLNMMIDSSDAIIANWKK